MFYTLKMMQNEDKIKSNGKMAKDYKNNFVSKSKEMI